MSREQRMLILLKLQDTWSNQNGVVFFLTVLVAIRVNLLFSCCFKDYVNKRLPYRVVANESIFVRGVMLLTIFILHFYANPKTEQVHYVPL